MAECNCNTPHRVASRPPATAQDVEDALFEAQVIHQLLEVLASAVIHERIPPMGGAFQWLADELGARLERMEAGYMTMWGAKP